MIVARFPSPPAESLEARQKLADLAANARDWNTRKRWLEAIVAADAAGRTDRSRFLAAAVEHLAADYRSWVAN